MTPRASRFPRIRGGRSTISSAISARSVPNCSPSFNWKKKLNDADIARFQPALAEMGYKFQFVTLAGFHSLNLSMFELARGYRDKGMTAYARLQENGARGRRGRRPLHRPRL